ncbi:MAG TPA: sigma factor-like helix-turn-helix DNA-binding protein, partial [Rubrivivax sp.]|nr:sigma factor-like helix-turn-helix DNA-binding protein [Rubrivivax sp.]
ARVFMAREWLEQDVEEICSELGITANNCGVMLHRARLQLRECLNRRWFTGAPR